MSRALDKLHRAKLFGKLHKCEFLKDKVDSLGFEVRREGILTSPENVKAILDLPLPQFTHDIRSFVFGTDLVLSNVYSWFLANR